MQPTAPAATRSAADAGGGVPSGGTRPLAPPRTLAPAGPPAPRSARAGGGAQGRDPAEPLPLEHHARPDALGHGGRQRPRGLGHVREGERATAADADLVGSDAPAAADGLGADHGERDDGSAGLERESP